MKVVHHECTKGQRALRAYLHGQSVPGFKGMALPDTITGEKVRDLTHFHLSRYAYVETVLLRALKEFCEIKSVEQRMEVRKLTEIPGLRDIFYAQNAPQPEEADELQTQLTKVIEGFVTHLPELVFELSSSAKFEEFFKAVRERGGCIVLLELLAERINQMILAQCSMKSVTPIIITSTGKIKPEFESKKEFAALMRLKTAFNEIAGTILENRKKRETKKTSNDLGRALFTEQEETALRLVRQELDSIDEKKFCKPWVLKLTVHSWR